MGTYILLVNSTDQGAKGVREIPNRQQSSRDTAAKMGTPRSFTPCRRASRPEIKVLYVSGYLSDSASVDAPKLGPLLQKPFTVGAFAKAIGLVLSRAK